MLPAVVRSPAGRASTTPRVIVPPAVGVPPTVPAVTRILPALVLSSVPASMVIWASAPLAWTSMVLPLPAVVRSPPDEKVWVLSDSTLRFPVPASTAAFTVTVPTTDSSRMLPEPGAVTGCLTVIPMPLASVLPCTTIDASVPAVMPFKVASPVIAVPATAPDTALDATAPVVATRWTVKLDVEPSAPNVSISRPLCSLRKMSPAVPVPVVFAASVVTLSSIGLPEAPIRPADCRRTLPAVTFTSCVVVSASTMFPVADSIRTAPAPAVT